MRKNKYTINVEGRKTLLDENFFTQGSMKNCLIAICCFLASYNNQYFSAQSVFESIIKHDTAQTEEEEKISFISYQLKYYIVSVPSSHLCTVYYGESPM